MHVNTLILWNIGQNYDNHDTRGDIYNSICSNYNVGNTIDYYFNYILMILKKCKNR